MLSILDKRNAYIVEQSNFFETNFLAKEGYINKENITSMFAIIGLADCVNRILQTEGMKEIFDIKD